MKHLASIMVLFLLAVPCSAQRVRYVVIGAAAGGDGSVGSPYDDLAEAITDEIAADVDISDEGGIEFRCSGGADGPVTIAGFTHGATRITVVGWDSPKTGIWDGTKYNLTSTAITLTLGDPVTLVDMQITSTANVSSGVGVNVGAGSGLIAENCIIRGQVTSGSGIGINVGAAVPVTLANCVVYGWRYGADADYRAVYVGFNATINLWNCTVVGNYTGVAEAASPTITLKNCYFGNTNDFTGTMNTTDYIVSNEDISGQCANYWSLPTAGSGDYSLDFTNADGGIFTLLATAADVLNKGVANPAGVGEYSYDIIDMARPQGVAWDIGAYEYIQPSGGTVFDPGFDVGFRNGAFED